MTSNSEKNKRVRAPNISEEEKSIILHCISKEKDIIECKKTDKFSNRDKNIAWERIAVNFNTHLGANKRDSKCLRRFWEVEKAKSKKGFARERKERMETGGGPEKESFDDSTPEINEIIARPQIVELVNIYDSDGIAFEQSMKLTEEIISISVFVDIRCLTLFQNLQQLLH
ncbi:myb/SANT-like DNA-binding domain-containing protein 3 [Aphis craccivora]|uniref:Regulatory protein zeste n=1 Tax=Aphis craccivora TaxID=307492 RepID=A0A6G0WKP7_APHCR|nr:myb/SANT-like DNA-binding domain-containing protein 3 [Aphis craccivora]